MNIDTTNKNYEFYYTMSDNRKIEGGTPIELKITENINTLDKVKEYIKEQGKNSTGTNAFIVHENEQINIYTTDGNKVEDIEQVKNNTSRVYHFRIESSSGGRRRSSAVPAKKRASSRRGRGSATKKRASARRQRHSRRRAQ